MNARLLTSLAQATPYAFRKYAKSCFCSAVPPFPQNAFCISGTPDSVLAFRTPRLVLRIFSHPWFSAYRRARENLNSLTDLEKTGSVFFAFGNFISAGASPFPTVEQKNKTKKLLYRVKIYDIMYNALILF